MSNTDELRRKVAWLESRVDQLESELVHLNHLLVGCGFPKGIDSLKATIQDLLSEMGDSLLPPEDTPPTQTFDPFT